MRRNRPFLLSAPMIALYFSAIGAVLLTLARERWGSLSWYPIAVGLVAAIAIMATKHLLESSLHAELDPHWPRIIFFGFILLLTLGGALFLTPEEPLIACGLFAASVLSGWAMLGTIFKWPGFRPSPEPDCCRECGYSLIGNESGTCPECGSSVGQIEDAMKEV